MSLSITPTHQDENLTTQKNSYRPSMVIVERSEIPSITSVNIDGSIHNLGIVKDFRKNDIISRFLPESPERTSFSWVRLLPGEVLSVHSHPTASLILICSGVGYFTGDISGRLSAGSTVIVPPDCFHGFCGAGEEGFWALSIQLESTGLYENQENPRVLFNNKKNRRDSMEILLRAHDFFMEDYKDNNFFSFLESEDALNPNIFSRFLDNLQYFSHAFQNIIKTRLENAESAIEYNLALKHLEEEKDHDVNFSKYRGNPKIENIDNEIKAIGQWFCDEMKEKGDAEKIVLMHLVLEGSGELAHKEVYKVTRDTPVGKHFLLHQEEDEDHLQMGVDALKKMNNLAIEPLLTSLIAGWSKMNRLCELMVKTAY